ncbi:MAG: polymorphic toxin type 23 domain-containing protein [Bacteroidota bacterium]
MNKWLFVGFFLLLLGPLGQSQSQQSEIHGLSGSIEANRFYFTIFPSARVGTHINELSYHIAATLNIPLWAKSNLAIGGQSTLRANAQYLGIPGGSFGAVQRLSFTWALGDQRETPSWMFTSGPFLRGHHLTYYGTHYASTDGTSQFSGGLRYQFFVGHKVQVQFHMENDFLAWRQRDEYRSGGSTIDVRWKGKKHWLGLGVGSMIWTGTTTGLPFLDFGQEYNMTNQYGSEYSHGIVYLNLHFNAFTLALGYDADSLRRRLQDPIHALIDDGTIPGGTLNEPGLFILLSWNAADWIY